MKCIVQSFFKDAAGEWHQPGNKEDFLPEIARDYQGRGYVKIVETAMVSQPETRVLKYRRARK